MFRNCTTYDPMTLKALYNRSSSLERAKEYCACSRRVGSRLLRRVLSSNRGSSIESSYAYSTRSIDLPGDFDKSSMGDNLAAFRVSPRHHRRLVIVEKPVNQSVT